MHTYLVILSGGMCVLLSALLIQKKLTHRFRRMAFYYNLLFFIIFLFAFFTHESTVALKDMLKDGLYTAISKVHLQTQAIHFIDNLDMNIPIIKIKDHVLLDAPLDSQLPELPRGCEVTSLSMLLQDAGIKVDKLTLANQIAKDHTPFQRKNGDIYFGDPNNGFVGNMYTKQLPGLGVYHTPIKELAEKYLPSRIIDFSGGDFKEVEMYLSDSSPVWVIINTAFKKLPDYQFETWHTPDGEVNVTYLEHAVLITGYDSQYVYFNDPLSGQKNAKALKQDFIAAWKQMGSQAITYLQK